MTLLAVPNVSEGRDQARIRRFVERLEDEGACLLDVHSDAGHNRSVLTVTGAPDRLIAGCVALAAEAAAIDLRTHQGVHPRLGGLDVCPFVPHDSTMEEAIQAAHETAARIGAEAELPVYLYGHAAERTATRDLPDLRRGGLTALARRAHGDLPPDRGPKVIDPRRGVVCVGARGPLIAFNIWLQSDIATARLFASQVRAHSVRALGLALAEDKAQVSMNLIDPASVGIEEVFEVVQAAAASKNVQITATEIVGLVEQRFMPGPDAEVTRLLLEPGHCLEERLLARG